MNNLKNPFWPIAKLSYLSLFGLMILIETCIALFVKDAFVRPFLGDTLATIGLYFGIRAVSRLRFGDALLLALVCSFFVEVLQYVHFLEMVGWNKYKFLRIIFGSSFSWGDLLAYTCGAGLVLIFERILGNANR